MNAVGFRYQNIATWKKCHSSEDGWVCHFKGAKQGQLRLLIPTCPPTHLPVSSAIATWDSSERVAWNLSTFQADKWSDKNSGDLVSFVDWIDVCG